VKADTVLVFDVLWKRQICFIRCLLHAR